MIGMSRTTGLTLAGTEHLRQSISDVLTTPIGSRVMRRDYGSLIPELIDQPMNQATQLRLYAATAHALIKWEPRLAISAITLYQDDAGTYRLAIDGEDETGGPLTTEVTI